MAGSTTAGSIPTVPTTVVEASDLNSRTLLTTGPSDTAVAAEAPEFIKPLSPRKRRRTSKTSPVSTRETRAFPAILSKKNLSPTFAPATLTGAAALADEQRAREEAAKTEGRLTSPNQTKRVIDMLAATNPMSRKEDAPGASNPLSGPLADTAPLIHVAPHAGDAMQTSPQSTVSSTSQEKAPTTTITSNGASVASPGQIDDAPGDDDESPRQSIPGSRDNSALPEEARSNKAFTYPGPLNAHAHRTSSLPQSGYGKDGSEKGSNKKHKCQYCNTDFTRQHNLKSHLLTHSQEKPFSCEACDARFRRLHDLKRHTKLHTGERPHVCPKCDRSFARGDALARHNKGQGGCAGRRESLGSFGGEDRHEERMRGGDGDAMAGLIYTGEASHEPEHMDEDGGSPQRNLPSIRQHEVPLDGNHRQASEHAGMYSRQPNTYPPVATHQPTTGGLYPPPPGSSPRAGSGTSVAPSLNTYQVRPGASTFQNSGPSIFAQGGMTESPKPLSPGSVTAHQLNQTDPSINRTRSPSITQQFQQQQFGRRTTGNNTSPSMSLPPPHPPITNSNAPHLPPIPGLTPPEPRFTLHSQASGPGHIQPTVSNSLPGPPHGPGSPGYPPGNLSSANNSLSSHGTGPPLSLDRTHNAYGPSYDRLFALLQSQEARLNQQDAKILQLENEMSVLKGQRNDGPSR